MCGLSVSFTALLLAYGMHALACIPNAHCSALALEIILSAKKAESGDDDFIILPDQGMKSRFQSHPGG